MVPSSERARFANDGHDPVAEGTQSPTVPVAPTPDDRLADVLSQQRATSEILSVMVASRNDATPVFETIASAVLTLCRASSAVVATYDGALLRVGAVASVTAAGADAIRSLFPRPASGDNGITRAVLTCDLVSIPDVLQDPDYATAESALASGFRSVLAVPLLHDGVPIGAISLGRVAPGPFPDTQVALLQTFADQAVIAIENVRLFTELDERNRDLTEALEQQTATSEILRVISQSQSDVQPVFDTIAKAALKLCRASSANVVTFDGELVQVASVAAAHAGGADALREHFRTYPRPPSRDTAAAARSSRAASSRSRTCSRIRTTQAGGTAAGRRLPQRPGRAADREAKRDRRHRRRPGRARSVPRQADRAAPDVRRPGGDRDRERAAVQRARRRAPRELTRSVGELKALGEVGQAVSSTLDLETVLSTIVSRATQLAGMDGGSIYEYDEDARGVPPAHGGPAARRAGRGAARHADPQGRGRARTAGDRPASRSQIRDIVDEGTYQSRVREILLRLGYRSLLAVPLLREDHLLGGLVVNRKTAGDFAPR